MAASRETIINALFTKLVTSGQFNTTGRRNRDPESIAPEQTPALLLVEHTEKYAIPSPSLPAKRMINLRAILYTDVGDDDNAIPATVINNLLDGVDAALVPDDPTSQRCTLGGLVYSVKIDGDVIKAPGDVTGKGLAIVPLQILIP
jgi:hypothetical protein